MEFKPPIMFLQGTNAGAISMHWSFYEKEVDSSKLAIIFERSLFVKTTQGFSGSHTRDLCGNATVVG